MLGSSSWMPCAPQGVKGLDDDDSSHSFRNSRIQIVDIRSLLRAFLNIVQIVVDHDADHVIQLLFLMCTVELHAHL